MTELLSYAIPGVPQGCVYALVAVSLVLVFKTSGVFNLAFGAQAYVSAAIFYVAVNEHHWNKAVAFVVAVVVAAPLLGFLLERYIFRYIRTSATVVKLVSGLGLLVGIPAIVQFLIGPEAKLNPPTLTSDPERLVWARYQFVENHLVTIGVTLVVFLALAVLFRYSALGLKMRALVESPRMVQLAGINADAVGSIAWMLSSLLVGLAGVLLAPLFANVNDTNFTVLLVSSIAAAAFGKLRSLPLTLLGGLLLGTLQQTITGYLPVDSILARGFRPAFPFLVLVLLLLFWPGLRKPRDVGDPLAACDPPPPALAATLRDASLERASRIAFPAFIVVFLGVSLAFVSDYFLFLLTQGLIFATIFLSITVLTGLSGQVSLCQATFAGAGAFTTAQLATNHGVPVLGAMVVGAVVAAGIGALVSIPALRLSGLYLALATLAFALMADNVIFPLRQVSGGQSGLSVPRPQVGPVNFADNEAFFLLSFAVFAICGVVVMLVRKGTTGRTLAALRGSELAASTIGINPVRAKVTVFTLSAAIAGLGGGMLAQATQQTSGESFVFFFSLVFVVVVLTVGSRTVEGAVNAGMAFIFLPEVLTWLQDWTGIENLLALQFALFGYGAVRYPRNPEGTVERQKRAAIEKVSRVLARRRARRQGSAVPASPDAAPPQSVDDDAHVDQPAEAAGAGRTDA